MTELYSFVDDVESLQEIIQRLNAVLIRVLELTTECGIFFREYTNHGFASECAYESVEWKRSSPATRTVYGASCVKPQPEDNQSIDNTQSTQGGRHVSTTAAYCERGKQNRVCIKPNQRGCD